jgi:hypothetical protein
MAQPEEYWESADGSERDEGRDRKLLIIGVVVSLFLHFTLAALFLDLQLGSDPDTGPDVVQIQLVATNPLASLPEEPVIEEAVVEEAEIAVRGDDEAIVETLELDTEEQLAPQLLETIAQETIPAEIEGLAEAVVLEQDVATLESIERSLPSITDVRRSVLTVDAEKNNKIYFYDCNQLEETAGLRDCKPTDNRNYQSVMRNSTYEAFNPPWEISRSRETVGLIARQSQDLSARLLDADIPAGLGEYLMEEVEASIELYSNTGNRTVEQMIRLTNTSATALQAESVLNDPWVQIQSRILRARSYSEFIADDIPEECDYSTILNLLTLQSFGCSF